MLFVCVEFCWFGHACLLSSVGYFCSQEFPLCFAVIRKGTFSKYDYGFFKNMKLYGQSKPPEFDLGHIPKSLPLWMAYGGNDNLADVTDLQHTLKELPSNPELLYLESYGHVDFILSIDAKKDIYDHMIGFFRSQGKRSSF